MPRDLPAPARPGPDSRATRAALVPYLRDARRQPPLPLAGAAGARAARRTATTSSTRAASPTSSAASDGLRALARAPGSASILDVVPNHMATSDENPFWRDPELREQFFDVDPRTGRPPAVLRRRRARRRPRRGPGGVRDDARARARARRARASSTACAIDHPDGLADPRGYLERLRASGVERIWVEKILEPGERLRDWPVEGTTGYEFLNDVQALFVDPRGRATALTRARRARRAVRTRSRPRRSSSRRATTFRARGRAAARGCSTCPTSTRALASLPRLPHLRRAVERPRRRAPTARRSRRLAAGGARADAPARGARATTSSSRASSRRPGR